MTEIPKPDEHAQLAQGVEVAKPAEYATWPKAEDFYAHPALLDRKLEEELTFRPPEAATNFTKETVQGVSLPLGELVRPSHENHGVLRSWESPAVDLQHQLDSLKKPFVEFGGPTYSDYSVLEGVEFPQKVLISNIESGLPIWPHCGEKQMVGGVDFQADVNHMPLGDESTGAVFVSALRLEPAGLSETIRVLEPGGLFFWNSTSLDGMKQAQDAGLELVKAVLQTEPAQVPHHDTDPANGEDIAVNGGLSFVFMKPRQDRQP